MNRGMKLTPRIIAELAEGYKAGKTCTELGKLYNMSKATVCRGLRKMGIEPERHDEFFTRVDVPQEIVDEICQRHKSGFFSIEAVSAKYNLSKSVINRLLIENGLVTDKRRYIKARTDTPTKTVKMGENMTKRLLSKKEQLELCDKFVNGPHLKAELAEEYKIHPDTVNATLRRHNCTVKKYLPEDMVDQICEDFKGGLGIPDLAEIYNRDPELIRYHLTNRGMFGTKEEGEPEAQALLHTVEQTIISTSAFRKLARGLSPRMLEIINDIANNPEVAARTRLTAAQLAIEAGHGKPKEMVEEEAEKQSPTDRILKLVSNKDKIFKKA